MKLTTKDLVCSTLLLIMVVYRTMQDGSYIQNRHIHIYFITIHVMVVIIAVLLQAHGRSLLPPLLHLPPRIRMCKCGQYEEQEPHIHNQVCVCVCVWICGLLWFPVCSFRAFPLSLIALS